MEAATCLIRGGRRRTFPRRSGRIGIGIIPRNQGELGTMERGSSLSSRRKATAMEYKEYEYHVEQTAGGYEFWRRKE